MCLFNERANSDERDEFKRLDFITSTEEFDLTMTVKVDRRSDLATAQKLPIGRAFSRVPMPAPTKINNEQKQ